MNKKNEVMLARHRSAAEFLNAAQRHLEEDEAANNLMLGLCLRLRDSPLQTTTPPYFATVMEDAEFALAAVLTPPKKVLLYAKQAHCPRACEAIARNLFEEQWPVPGVFGAAAVAKLFAESWALVTGMTSSLETQQRIYQLRKVLPPRFSSGMMRPASFDQFALVVEWVAAFEQEIFGKQMAHEEARALAERKLAAQEIYFWWEGAPVAMAGKARATAHGIAVNLVYTPPALRGKGYATSLVASLSQLLLDEGRAFCVLFTDLANPTSNRIYQKIGYQPVCDWDEYVFNPSVP